MINTANEYLSYVPGSSASIFKFAVFTRVDGPRFICDLYSTKKKN